MPRFLTFTLAALCASLSGIVSLPAVAQEAEPIPDVAPVQVNTQIAPITADNFATLPALLPRRAAISLGVDGATLEAAPETRDQLLDWTRNGGIVFLHNDAARLFGYQTVPARLGNSRQAGQLFGRAVSALPFGAHPLLQGLKAPVRPVDPSRLPGVNVVFYSMKEGDELVVSHPAGTPLLEVTDLTGTENRPLYAAAIAPFGRGYAVFTPDYIDQKRGDGAAFAANLLTLTPAPVARTANAAAAAYSGPRYVSVSQTSIDRGTATVITELGRALTREPISAPALPPLGAPLPATVPNVTAPADVDGNGVQDAINTAPVAPGVPVAAVQTPVLMLTREEAVGFQSALKTAPAAALAILRTRVAILRGDIPVANSQLAALIQVAPTSAEAAFLNGILNTNLANQLAISSVDRSAAAKTASDEFTRSANSRAIITVAAQPNQVTAAPIAGATVAQIRVYATELARLSRLFSFDPPLVTTIGQGGESIIVRYAPGDLAYGLVLQAAQLISSSRLSGWRTDRQEILLFPSAQTYAAYRAASGQTTQNVPSPGAAGGDVVGSRIIMATAPVGFGSLTVAFLARLQAYSLLNAWYDGTGRVPLWLAIGLENQVANVIGVQLEPDTGNNNQTLEQFAQVGGLLTPAQFETQTGSPSRLASIQATSLVDYFYKVYGTGAFTETVQRLASGDSPDDALDATTQLDQLGFFQAWRGAQFGPRRFPNAG